ncbi:related to CTK2 - beta subunit of C-terminal domain kinase I [Ustilago trichophora]|uniref:Related to CTK2 - beta subunit of C-terminal domain kinase I n=1 Tax=Ustilago trichophora TaxID=86804 RepID=A0A5C3EKU8_9BASI|nr:related to CTK2 - beta subunit of C-terminal domain kinase I [Ustilago trichophora]
MPAYAHGPPPDATTWRNDARYPTSSSSSSGPTHLRPPTGPSRGMPSQAPSSMAQPALPSQMAPAAPSAAPSIPEPPAIPTFSHIPYFTSVQLETLYARRRGARMSSSMWLTSRDIATGFIQSVASRLGFPQRTIATAQQIYQRFHLFYPPSDFVLHEIAVASLFVAAKLNDTHKKPRDLLLASYALRFPQLVKGSSDVAGPSNAAATAVEETSFPALAGQKRKHPTSSNADTCSPRPLAMAIGSVGEADIDVNILETERKRLMALEKLILESLCFNFHSNANSALKMVIKIGRRCGLAKSFIRTAWKVAADMFRTSAPMQYPPNVVAVACLYGAALLARLPSRSLPAQQEEVSQKEGDGKDDDALTTFLNSINSVSTTPAPPPSTTTSTSPAKTLAQIPLSEPFPGCDPECRVHVEDVEEAVHELLDLYLSCTAQLPPSLYMTPSTSSGLGPSSAGATPSPLSPADPLDVYAASPSSTGSEPTAHTRKKLRQYEYSPPPFGLVDWLNSARCAQLQASSTNATIKSQTSTRKNALAGGGASNVDPTAPIKELSALLTDIKIYLRGLEYDRQRADDAYLAQVNMIAQVDVIPIAGSDPAAAATVGMLGVAAHSVQILLQPLDPAQAVKGNTALDPMKGLDEEKRRIVERIRRRKLVGALRLTFVEPEVERRPNINVPTGEAGQKQQQHQQQQQQQQKKADPTPGDASPAKKNRIELAKRYLF